MLNKFLQFSSIRSKKLLRMGKAIPYPDCVSKSLRLELQKMLQMLLYNASKTSKMKISR